MDVKMKQRAVIEFLLLQRSDDEEIAQRLRNAHGDGLYFLIAIFRWIKEVRNGNENSVTKGGSRPYQYEIDSYIQDIREDDPFASLRMIADMLSISPETVRTHLS
jgi:DNA-binding NarL/FixJ family response regulator